MASVASCFSSSCGIMLLVITMMITILSPCVVEAISYHQQQQCGFIAPPTTRKGALFQAKEDRDTLNEDFMMDVPSSNGMLGKFRTNILKVMTASLPEDDRKIFLDSMILTEEQGGGSPLASSSDDVIMNKEIIDRYMGSILQKSDNEIEDMIEERAKAKSKVYAKQFEKEQEEMKAKIQVQEKALEFYQDVLKKEKNNTEIISDDNESSSTIVETTTTTATADDDSAGQQQLEQTVTSEEEKELETTTAAAVITTTDDEEVSNNDDSVATVVTTTDDEEVSTASTIEKAVVANDDDKKNKEEDDDDATVVVIKEAVSQLQQRFPEMFSPSKQCRVPNVNADKLSDEIFLQYRQRGSFWKNNDEELELLEWLLQQNEVVKTKYEEIGITSSSATINPKAWKKVTSSGFYLGLDTSWLTRSFQ